MIISKFYATYTPSIDVLYVIKPTQQIQQCIQLIAVNSPDLDRQCFKNSIARFSNDYIIFLINRLHPFIKMYQFSFDVQKSYHFRSTQDRPNCLKLQAFNIFTSLSTLVII